MRSVYVSRSDNLNSEMLDNSDIYRDTINGLSIDTNPSSTSAYKTSPHFVQDNMEYQPANHSFFSISLFGLLKLQISLHTNVAN